MELPVEKRRAWNSAFWSHFFYFLVIKVCQVLVMKCFYEAFPFDIEFSIVSLYDKLKDFFVFCFP